jgi:hypothetical protein
MRAKCAWCGKKRQAGDICPACGANYEKAAAIKAGGKATTPELDRPAKARRGKIKTAAEKAVEWEHVKDPRFEYQLCLGVVPGFLLFWLLVNLTGIGKTFQAIVFGMPIHELGHAFAGWFCGYSSVPTVWKTLTPTSRGFIAPVVVFAALSYWGYLSFTRKKLGFLLLCTFLIILQFIGTFVLEVKTSQMFITFSGEGLGMVLAVALMSTFFFGKGTQLYKGWLRWGFVCIGAAAFNDIFVRWVQSLSDTSLVPLGEQEGTHSDGYKMLYYHGWEMGELINANVQLGIFCLIVLGLFYWRGCRFAQRQIALADSDSSNASDASGS